MNLDGLTYIERNKVNFLFFSLVQLAVSPRAKSLDVGQIFPRNLRAEILSKIGQMTGLEKLDLSSRVGNGGAGGVWGGGSAMTGVTGGSSPTAWAPTWKSLRTLTRLRHFTLRQDCQVAAVPFYKLQISTNLSMLIEEVQNKHALKSCSSFTIFYI